MCDTTTRFPLATLCIALACGSFSFAPSAKAQLVPANDLTIFADAGRDDWPFIMNQAVNLTDHPGDDRFGVWSPDGSKMAFITYRDGNDEIYVVDADGSNVVNLTNHEASDGLGGWSPDGTKIAFSTDRDGDREVYVMDADGSNPVNLTNDPGSDSVSPNPWSADGSQIVFSSRRAAESPFDDDIYVMDADGANPFRVSADPHIFAWGSWSPHGSTILFQWRRDGKTADLFTIEADGSNLTNVTNASTDDMFGEWSPDGTRIAYTSSVEGNLEVFVVDADGANPINLTDRRGLDMHPKWSPDGARIAFLSDRGGGDQEIFLMDVDGDNVVNLSNTPGLESIIDWTPDGSQVAAIAYPVDEHPEIIAFHVEASGPGVTPVVHEGKLALPVEVNGRWGGRFQAPMDIVDFEALEFIFHPGDVSPASWKTFSTSIQNRVGLLSTDLVDPDELDWQAVRIPKRMFEPTGSIESILFKGNVEGTFYLADMRLIGAEISTPTAVLETHTTTRPQSFVLEQNFPNPFNSNTVIRFDLPSSGMAEMILYNLAGQKIATLVQGLRPAGTHTLHWDGRDDDGRDLASGMYLYQLQAGGQVQMRKLVLIR
jgi:Tol biopolymer transport system component